MRSKVTSDGAVLLRQLEEGGTNSDEAAAAQQGVLALCHGRTKAEDEHDCHAQARVGGQIIAQRRHFNGLMLSGRCVSSS